MMERVTDPDLIKQLDEIRLSKSSPNGKKVTDPDLIKQLDSQRLKQENNNSKNLFQFRPGSEVLQDVREELSDPNRAAKAGMQAVGTLGMAMIPGMNVMKGVGMIPSSVNAISRSGVSGGFGAMANPDNPLEGGVLGAIAPPIARFAMKTVPALLKKTTPEKIGNYIREGYNALEGKAVNLLENVGKEAVKRGINILPVNKKLIRSLSEYFPKTNASKKLIANAETGDYEALRKIQSDMFHRANKMKNSTFQADRDIAEEIFEKRNDLNKFISDHFKNTGHSDLAEQLGEGVDLYKQLQKLYHTKKLPKSIRDIYDPELLQISPKLEEILSKNSLPINKLIQSNPLVAKELETGLAHQNALKTIKRLGIGSGLGLGTVGAFDVADFIKNALSNK